jgi:hypothetical protein
MKCIEMVTLEVTSDHIFNPVVSTIPKWGTFKLLRQVQRNPLLTFEHISGFGRNFVWG